MRVFIVCPSKLATGGTELLHQFSKCLRDRSTECYMIYLGDSDLECPTPEIFLKYDVKYVSQYIDANDSVLVLPESQAHLADICKKGVVMLWWLSVDNYIRAYEDEIIEKGMDVHNLKSRENVIHFVQSQYAKEFLKCELEIDTAYSLKDYINDDIVKFASTYGDKLERYNYCLYNPQKGYQNIEPIIQRCRADITWVPLRGFKPQEMAALMCSSKVYIDFGGHPGKDRIPREAGVCGCCVITNRQGSAAYGEDVNIPEKYKIGDMTDIEATLNAIYDCIDSYEERQREYNSYKDIIMQEKQEFEEEVDECLEKLRYMIKSRNGNEELQLDEQHLIMLDTFKRFVQEMDLRLDSAKKFAETNNRASLINSLLEVDYLLQVMKEGICYEEVSIAEE